MRALRTRAFASKERRNIRCGRGNRRAALRPFVKEPLSQQLGIRGVSNNEKAPGLASFQPVGLAPLGDEKDKQQCQSDTAKGENDTNATPGTGAPCLSEEELFQIAPVGN